MHICLWIFVHLKKKLKFISLINIRHEKACVHEAKIHTCHHCHKNFSRWDNLCEHMKIHSARPSHILSKKCETCLKELFSDFGLVNHKCVKKKDLKIKCDLCDKEIFKKHLKGHACQALQMVKVKCFVCKEKFSHLGQTLERHIKRFHSKTSVPRPAVLLQLDEDSIIGLITDVGISDRKLLKILRNEYIFFLVQFFSFHHFRIFSIKKLVMPF